MDTKRSLDLERRADDSDQKWDQEAEGFYDQGRALWRSRASAYEIEKALAQVPGEYQDFLRGGLLDQLSNELRADKGVNETVRKVLAGGSEMNRRLRLIFPDDSAYQQFQDTVAEMKATVQFAEGAQTAIRLGLAGIAGTAIGLATVGLASILALYGFFAAGAILGAAVFYDSSKYTVSGGMLVPLALVLLAPLLLAAAGVAVLLLLA